MFIAILRKRLGLKVDKAGRDAEENRLRRTIWRQSPSYNNNCFSPLIFLSLLLFSFVSLVPLLIFFSVNLGRMNKSSKRVVICFSQDTLRALAKGRTGDQFLKRLLRSAVSPKEFVVNNAQLLPLPTIEEQDEDESVTVSSSDSVGPGSNHEFLWRR